MRQSDMKHMTSRLIVSYRDDCRGVVANEFILVFPVLLIIIFGMWDVGNGLWAGQKTIKSSHIIADLLARESFVDDDRLAQAVEAGRHAFAPFAADSYTVEVLHVTYDEEGLPEELWNHTHNTVLDPDLIHNATGLGGQGDGTLIVRVGFRYVPAFSSVILNDISITETAYTRGRKAPIIQRLDH